MLKLNDLKPNKGSRKKLQRVGRGHGSGWGTQAGRGHKGQQARTGGRGVPYHGFEGGQNPLYKRTPKLGGFRPHNKIEYTVVNVADLADFKEGSIVNAKSLSEAGLVRRGSKNIKILGNGELKTSLIIQVVKVSKTAQEKIEKAKGKVELIAGFVKKEDMPEKKEK
jgi:large subunit ribosomal protein L15